MKKLVVIINILLVLTIHQTQTMDCNDMYDDIDADEWLENIIEATELDKDVCQRCNIAIQLLEKGVNSILEKAANPNKMVNGTSLLHKALILNHDGLVKALFKYDANYNETDCLRKYPIFFDAQTVEIVQLFIDKQVDVGQKDLDDCNVLWHLIDSKFSAELMRFYLQHNVNANHICKWDGSCVLHSFAENKVITDVDQFLKKVRLLLKKSPDMVNTVNNNGETPIASAERTIKTWGEKYPACVEPLQKLIELFKNYGQK